jgi:hypothetical protein
MVPNYNQSPNVVIKNIGDIFEKMGTFRQNIPFSKSCTKKC